MQHVQGDIYRARQLTQCRVMCIGRAPWSRGSYGLSGRKYRAVVIAEQSQG